MNTVQRQFGKLTVKGAGNDAHISVILQDFEEADKMLTKIIEASKAWRDAWSSILNVQVGVLTAFDELYNPIIGHSGEYNAAPIITQPEQVERISRLKEGYEELKAELLDEVNMMDSRIIRPAMDAKESIQPLKKTIKKRDNKRLDYERYQDKVYTAQKKPKRSDRDNIALAKAEEELSKAADEFRTADAHLKESLPPIIAAVFSILPHLLSAQIIIQNTVLAQYYTTLHNYCQEQGFQSPPPPMEDVLSQWEQDFKPIQREVEAISMIARGKAIHAPMHQGSSITGLGIRNQINSRRGSSNPPLTRPEPRTNRIPSTGSIPSTALVPTIPRVPTPDYEEPPEPEYESRPAPSPFVMAYSPAGPTKDYFVQDRTGSNGSTPGSVLSPGSSVIGKKKPPPPPPKRFNSNTGLFVTAVYTFSGQEVGDLSFKEGDVIKVLKKTGSTDDWWEGDLNGQKGKFPANYCQAA